MHVYIFYFFQVGLIIGRGGDTIRNLQSQSGARIQVSWEHPQRSFFFVVMVNE
jgi:polyribonucleotide nucleotidyltransferase